MNVHIDDRLLTPDELEAELRAIGAERYHHLHPFHKLLHGGKLTRQQVQASREQLLNVVDLGGPATAFRTLRETTCGVLAHMASLLGASDAYVWVHEPDGAARYLADKRAMLAVLDRADARLMEIARLQTA